MRLRMGCPKGCILLRLLRQLLCSLAAGSMLGCLGMLQGAIVSRARQCHHCPALLQADYASAP